MEKKKLPDKKNKLKQKDVKIPVCDVCHTEFTRCLCKHNELKK